MTAAEFVRATRGAGILALAVAIVVTAGILLGKPSTQAAQVKSEFGAVARYIFIRAAMTRWSPSLKGTAIAWWAHSRLVLFPNRSWYRRRPASLWRSTGLHEAYRSSTWRMAIGLRSNWTSRPIG